MAGIASFPKRSGLEVPAGPIHYNGTITTEAGGTPAGLTSKTYYWVQGLICHVVAAFTWTGSGSMVDGEPVVITLPAIASLVTAAPFHIAPAFQVSHDDNLTYQTNTTSVVGTASTGSGLNHCHIVFQGSALDMSAASQTCKCETGTAAAGTLSFNAGGAITIYGSYPVVNQSQFYV